MRWILAVALVSFVSSSCPGDKHCRSCVDGYCAVCFDSVKDEQAGCDAKIDLIPHCAQYSRVEGVVACWDCAPGYGLSAAGTCERCTAKNCASCRKSLDVCDKCFEGLLPEEGNCSSQKIADSNCLIASSAMVCSLCREGFSLSPAGECVKGPANCLRMLTADACFLCLDGTYIDEQSHCQGKPKPVPDFSTFSLFKFLLLALAFAGLFVGAWYCVFAAKGSKDGLLIGEREI